MTDKPDAPDRADGPEAGEAARTVERRQNPDRRTHERRTADRRTTVRRASDARTPGASHVHRELREEILALTLRPGDELDEAALAARFGCSRTTVREALLTLAADRLVELLPNRGARIAPLDLVELPRFIEAFDFLSRAIHRYAAERRSPQQLAEITRAGHHFDDLAVTRDPAELTVGDRTFHLAIAEAADNRYLAQSWRGLQHEGMRLLHLALGRARSDAATQQEYLASHCADHRELTAAIDARDGSKAEEIARAHTAAFRDRVFAYLRLDAGDAVRIRPLPEPRGG